MNVVLAMITRNSFSELGKTLLRVLNSSLQIPYKSLILVDDSTDNTPSVVKQWCEENDKEIIVSRSRLYGYHRPTRATARQTAIDIFFESFSNSCEWLMFLDDDAVLNNGWWKEARQYIDDPEIGIIWGLNYDATPVRRFLFERLGINYIQYLIQQFEYRGGTHDTLLRRDALRGIRIPPELHIFEDAYIKHYICCKGYRYAVLKTGITHMNPGRKASRRELSEMARYGLLLGLEDPRYRNRLFGLYALARTTAGIPLTILTYAKFGLTGIKEGFYRARNKWLYRLYLWIYSQKIRFPEDRCRAILQSSNTIANIN